MGRRCSRPAIPAPSRRLDVQEHDTWLYVFTPAPRVRPVENDTIVPSQSENVEGAASTGQSHQTRLGKGSGGEGRGGSCFEGFHDHTAEIDRYGTQGQGNNGRAQLRISADLPWTLPSPSLGAR